MKTEVQVYRYNPMFDKNPYYQKFLLNIDSKFRILDVLVEIIKNYKTDISFETSCQAGVCGLCSVMLNHKPVLMCKEPVSESMIIEPLKNFKVVNDLMINRIPYQNRLKKYDLFIFDKLVNRHFSAVNKEEYMEKTKLASRCMRCFCCLAACPIYSKHPDIFAGPAAFVLEAYYTFHPLDGIDRSRIINKMGIELCRECNKCSDVCPFNVNPMELIIEMKAYIQDFKKE